MRSRMFLAALFSTLCGCVLVPNPEMELPMDSTAIVVGRELTAGVSDRVVLFTNPNKTGFL